MRSKKPCSAGKPAFVIFITLLLASAIVPAQARATKFKVLHTFHGRDGNGPAGVLARDSAGNLYGTTEAGGTGRCGDYGCGTAFKFNKNGKKVWVHSFDVADGEEPLAGLLRDAAGNLFGTTSFGGRTSCDGGCGTVFELGSNGTETVIYKFKGQPNVNWPDSLLTEDKSGALYGTTPFGGQYGYGAVFKVTQAGHETVLYSFTGGSDGCLPAGGVILNSSGDLYGVAAQGGTAFCDQGHGVVYQLNTSGTLTVLHDFGGGDGAYPGSMLLFDASGNLYGTTAGGGNYTCGPDGCGVVFELSPNSNGTWTEGVLYQFCSLSGCADGLMR